MSRLMVMAGGTGGHVMPALAVARLLKENGVDIRWIGNPEGLEAKLVPEAGFELETIRIKGLRRSGFIRKLTMPFMLAGACIQVLRIVLRFRPDALLGMGGFVSGPGGVVGGLMGKPLVLHEQNAVAGLTNRLLAPFAKKVLSGFPVAEGVKKAQWVGNPVRNEIASIATPTDRLKERSGPVKILVVGGSQGAQVFNKQLPELFADSALPPVDIWHQCGKGRAEGVVAAYAKNDVSANAVEFIDDMAAAYTWCDLIICRSGAMTVAEVCAAGVSAIFVPYPYAVSDHQSRNADHLAKTGAALSIPQADFVSGRWLSVLTDLAEDRPKILEMAVKARSLAKPDATRDVADICVEAMDA
ncbi:MAG: undecaprenyldiphospho-muramoylpentapeptide beta-N-acetylglucosaminyltransferase [Acidiferrobacterales bacterium]|nr:undecaprenyldiphospho-muramoylpentapeptide beta-N-acetylglucosaminyltransferase [Acidiferrobacterales bacterium]